MTESQRIEMLLKDLLRITAVRSDRLSEVLAENFNFFDEQIVKILGEEYRKPRSDWKVIGGCFSVIWRASQEYPRIGNEVFRGSYPLINKGLLDRRVSVKRLAALSALNVICRIYLERRFMRIGKRDCKEINEEISELRKHIRSEVFLESFASAFPRLLDKRISCESAGIKEESLVTVSRSLLG